MSGGAASTCTMPVHQESPPPSVPRAPSVSAESDEKKAQPYDVVEIEKEKSSFVHCEIIDEGASFDPAYTAKARILGDAFQEIGMGKYQVRRHYVSLCGLADVDWRLFAVVSFLPDGSGMVLGQPMADRGGPDHPAHHERVSISRRVAQVRARHRLARRSRAPFQQSNDAPASSLEALAAIVLNPLTFYAWMGTARCTLIEGLLDFGLILAIGIGHFQHFLALQNQRRMIERRPAHSTQSMFGDRNQKVDVVGDLAG
ncbi:hypothetical protein NUW54_g7399 [Trametes sanguinea]|uniref:Uncharacterized protein n=1 Tax=Trametes sanguinea TaxID=158606 RepID=A0ACC1PMY2_9APHY|nr:hypothetical protein NUW54_g7399 [Trametes sanguinea]